MHHLFLLEDVFQVCNQGYHLVPDFHHLVSFLNLFLCVRTFCSGDTPLLSMSAANAFLISILCLSIAAAFGYRNLKIKKKLNHVWAGNEFNFTSSIICWRMGIVHEITQVSFLCQSLILHSQMHSSGSRLRTALYLQKHMRCSELQNFSRREVDQAPQLCSKWVKTSNPLVLIFLLPSGSFSTCLACFMI